MTATRALLAPLVLVPVLVVSACGGSKTTAGSAPTASAAPTTAAATTSAAAPASTAAATTAAAPASAAASSGCAAKGTGVPAGAMTKPIVDVDGDGKADTGWATSTGTNIVFGITTASGDTTTIQYGQPAGGTAPTMLVADVDGKGTIAAVVAYSRGAELYVFSGCALAPATNPQGQQYSFDVMGVNNQPPSGVGCSTVAGASGQTLVALDQAGTTMIKRTQVVLTGTKATNGLTDTVAGDPSTQTGYSSISCGNLTLMKDGVPSGND